MTKSALHFRISPLINKALTRDQDAKPNFYEKNTTQFNQSDLSSLNTSPCHIPSSSNICNLVTLLPLLSINTSSRNNNPSPRHLLSLSSMAFKSSKPITTSTISSHKFFSNSTLSSRCPCNKYQHSNSHLNNSILCTKV